MDLFDVSRSCLRRWYVFLPLLIIVAWFTHSAYTSVKPVYYSNAVIGISPPSSRVDQVSDGAAVPRNGLLDIGGAPLIANLTTLGLQQQAAMERVFEGGGVDYGAKMFPVAPGTPQLPLVMVEVTNADPAAVTKTLELVIAEADVTLKALQQQAMVPEGQMMTAFVVSAPGVPGAVMPTRTRSTVAIFVAGLGLSVVVTVLIDVALVALAARRRRIKARPPAPLADDVSPLNTPSDSLEPDAVIEGAEGAVDAR